MKLNITKIAIAGVMAAAVTACAAPKEAMDPAVKEKTKAAVEQLFAKKDVVPKLKRKCEKEVVKITLSKLRDGFETLDIAKIKPYLAEKFQYKFRISEKRFALETREEFLKAREEWKGKAKDRKAIYNIQGVKVNKEKTVATVTSFVSVKTKYFAPRLMEVLTFTKEEGKWKVLEQAQIPLYPNAPDMHEVQIFLSKALKDENGNEKPANFVKAFTETAVAKGPDAAFENIKPLEKSEAKFGGGAERKADVIVAFKEPPAFGSDINVKIKQECDAMKRTYQRVRSVSPYFLMTGQMKVKPCASKVNIKVDVDGLVIAEKDFDIPK